MRPTDHTTAEGGTVSVVGGAATLHRVLSAMAGCVVLDRPGVQLVARVVGRAMVHPNERSRENRMCADRHLVARPTVRIE